MTDTLTVQRRQGSPTPGRYPAETWTDQSDLACALQPMKTSKRIAYGSDRAPRMYTVFVSPTSAITENDRLKITANGVIYYLLVRSAPIDVVSGGAVMEIDAEHIPGVSG